MNLVRHDDLVDDPVLSIRNVFLFYLGLHRRLFPFSDRPRFSLALRMGARFVLDPFRDGSAHKELSTKISLVKESNGSCRSQSTHFLKGAFKTPNRRSEWFTDLHLLAENTSER